MAAQLVPLEREAPASLSKTIEKALGCERYFVLRYLAANPPAQSSSAAARGTAFHSYRDAYIQHLREAKLPQDPQWVRAWVKQSAIETDAMELILADAEHFKVRLEEIYATELFIAVDREFTVTEVEPNSTRRWPGKKESRYHGCLDHVEVDRAEKMARILDVKTGFTDKTVRDYEASHYAGLLFALLPEVHDIDFSWSFPRIGTTSIPLAFNRRLDYPWIREQMERRYQSMTQLAERVRAGAEPGINPTAGLCHYCPYTCPARSAAERGLYIDKPLQTDRDAIALARRVHAANLYVMRGRELLEAYLENGGRLALGNDLVAEVRPGVQSEYRLDKVAEVLGLEVPESSRYYDVPLDGLLVGSTALKQYAKAKKRTGLMEKLAEVARTKPRFRLHIGRSGEDEQ